MNTLKHIKMCRLVQYLIMLASPTLIKEGERFRELTEKLDKLQDSMIITRKVLRFGLPISILKRIKDRIKDTS